MSGETSRLPDALTPKGESSGGSAEPHGEPGEGDLDPKMKAGFQKALQKSQEKVKKLEDALKERDRKDLPKEKQLEQERNDALIENAQLKLSLFADQLLKDKTLPAAMQTIVRDRPWVLPGIAEFIPEDNISWDEVVNIVKEKLPNIVDSLVVGEPAVEEIPGEEPARKAPTERSPEGHEVKRYREYTQAEVAELSKKPEEFAKHKEAILKQLEKYGGKLTP